MRRDARKKNDKKIDDQPTAPGYMNTYGDMVTLLLTFFVLLFTFASIDVDKFHEVMSAIQHSFMGRTGILEGTTEHGGEEADRLDPQELTAQDVTTGLGERELSLLEQMEEMEETIEEVSTFLQEAGLEEDVRMRIEERGVVLELPERILFDTGRAELRDDFLPVLDLMADLLYRIDNQVIVEGHTDNVPIQTARYPSNWELSVDRAVSVVRYLSEEHELVPERFQASGYGEYHPVATNETAEGRARNRRVTIVFSVLTMDELDIYEGDG